VRVDGVKLGSWVQSMRNGYRRPGARKYWSVRDELTQWLELDETRVNQTVANPDLAATVTHRCC
jgi:hypothetical protein